MIKCRIHVGRLIFHYVYYIELLVAHLAPNMPRLLDKDNLDLSLIRCEELVKKHMINHLNIFAN